MMTLKKLPELQEQIGFEQKVRIANKLRMFKNYTQRIANLLKLERYAEAELLSARFSGICRAWDYQRQMNLDQCMKGK